jgi:type II secretory pathway predicted ATPase ExeA
MLREFGFTKMPFGKALAPSALYKSQGHQEAVARIAFLVGEAAIGVVTGEVGSGKTVAARAALALNQAHSLPRKWTGRPDCLLLQGYPSLG